MPPEIRPARAEDLPGLLTLYRHLNPADPVPAPEQAAAAWQAMLAQPGLTIVLAELAGELVASCTLILVPNLMRGTRAVPLMPCTGGTALAIVFDRVFRGEPRTLRLKTL
jgi:hypothetical protein